MLTLYHAPYSRSSRIVALIDELGAADKVTIRLVNIRRLIPPGGERDPANPHPEGKVPLLIDGPAMIRESTAIILYLCEKFPESAMGTPVGHPDRGRFLSWLSYYGSVVEPVVIMERFGIEHPALPAVYRGPHEVIATLASALKKGPYLMGDHYTAADLLLALDLRLVP